MLDIRRRPKLLTLLGGAAAVWPLPLSAQTPSRLWKIGVLANEPWAHRSRGLRPWAAGSGLCRGKRVIASSTVFAPRACGARFPCPGVRSWSIFRSTLIVGHGAPRPASPRIIYKATSTIPIVMFRRRPRRRWSRFRARTPGAGNVTGMSVQMAEQEGEKRLELLKKLLPDFFRGLRCFSKPQQPLLRSSPLREARPRGNGIGPAVRPCGCVGISRGP